MKCALHPDIETSLSCGKCGTPICPRCMVQTPVGARCRACARLYRIPTYNVKLSHYLRAAGAGLGMALAGGAAWGFVISLLRGFLPLYLNLLIAPLVGYLIGEVIGLATNRKRGIGLAVLGGVSLLLAYLVALLVPWGLRFFMLDILAFALGVFVAVSRLR
ncbi:MAG: B-box zinc finger protein [Chloroflexi bacterium]|nr:B-box zinc finger protein [Chloroflexota bacterium]